MKIQHIHRENNNLTILASYPKNNNKSLHIKMNCDTYLIQNIKNMNQEHAAFALSNRTPIETNTPSKHIQGTHTRTHTYRVYDDRSKLYHACARFGRTIVRGLEGQLNTPCANTAHANLSCTKRNWGNQILHCLLSREPRRLRQMLILMMLVEI